MQDDHNDDDRMAQLRERVLEAVLAELQAGLTPLEIAAILNTVGLSIYRTVLDDTEYHRVTDAMHDSRDLIGSLAPLSERRLH